MQREPIAGKPILCMQTYQHFPAYDFGWHQRDLDCLRLLPPGKVFGWRSSKHPSDSLWRGAVWHKNLGSSRHTHAMGCFLKRFFRSYPLHKKAVAPDVVLNQACMPVNMICLVDKIKLNSMKIKLTHKKIHVRKE